MFKSKIISYTILFTSLFTILSGYSGASIDPFFRSTWRVPEGDKSITLPLVSGHNYNFTVDWGDGETSVVTSHNDPNRTHTYMAAGDYNLVIEGILEAWSFNNSGDKDKIISVEDFGDLGYKNLSRAFFGCTNLGVFEGGVTSDVTNMARMFLFADSVNPDVSEWDVSSVTNMASMFVRATQANPNVSKWNVSSVTNMAGMFHGSGLTTANYDALLINLADNNASLTNIQLGVVGINYSSDDAETARNTLKNDRGWAINDAGDATPP